MIEVELLNKCYAVLDKLMENGQFFATAIEFDPDDFSIDGEKIHDEIQSILNEIEDYRKVNKK